MPKIALITGANKGIGLETARQLGRDCGFTVLVGARNEIEGQSAASTLQNEGLEAYFLALDPTDSDSVSRAKSEVEARFGRLDVLVNNAGTMLNADFLPANQVSMETLHATFEINVFGLHQVTAAFWPLLEKSDSARLVNVSSAVGSLTLHANGSLGDLKILAYNASKAAVNMMTIHYAHLWRDTPHRANAVHPGSAKTHLNPRGNITCEAAAKNNVEMVMIGSDGPNGHFFHQGKEMPW